ncbi:MAG TPA: hypothetical protein VHB98_20360 [Chloroflexota bacterium]|jgi:hypothetical protein|nr:hypothetical protein [Chloroflexota bacterium]
MGFLSKLFGGNKGSAPAGNASGDPNGFHFYVRCDRCGELLHIRVNRATDISDEYDGETTVKVVHKEILGTRCQNLMYVHLTLDASYHITEANTERCTLIDRAAYEAGVTG